MFTKTHTLKGVIISSVIFASILLFGFLMTPNIANASHLPDGDGDGLLDIESCADLQSIGNSFTTLNESYELINDINFIVDCPVFPFTPIGTYTPTVIPTSPSFGGFNGTFDGGGFTISDLDIDLGSATNFAALFAYAGPHRQGLQ